MPHLLIAGANGTLGSAAARHFLQKGFTVTALVRRAENAADLKGLGAVIRTGDLTDPASIKGICDGADVVLTAVHGLMGRGRNKSSNVDGLGHRRLIDEAKAAGVKHFIYISVSNASPDHPVDFVRTKYATEQWLQQSGLHYSILRLPAFMETHAWMLLGKSIAEKGKATIFGKGEKPYNFVAIRDVVAVLDLIALNESFYKRIIPVAGPADISRKEIASLFAQAAGKPLRVSHVPVGVIKLMSVLLRPFHPGLARIMQLTVLAENSEEVMKPSYSIARFGLAPTSVKQFAEEKVQALKQVSP